MDMGNEVDNFEVAQECIGVSVQSTNSQWIQ